MALRRWLLALFVVAASAAGAAALAVPRLAHDAAALALSRTLGAPGGVEVELLQPSPLRLLAGRFGPVRVRAQGARAGALELASVQASAESLSVDPLALLLKHRIVVTEQRGLRAQITVGQGALNDWLAHQLPPGHDLHLTLGPGRVDLRSSLTYRGRSFHLAAEGRFLPGDDGRSLALAIDSLRVNGYPVPAAIRHPLLDLWGAPWLRVELPGLPMQLRIARVRTEAGRLVVEAFGA